MDTRELKLFPQGDITMPPSKSVAHRAIICAGLAQGESEIANVSESEDMGATLGCIQSLGAHCVRRDGRITVGGGVFGGGAFAAEKDSFPEESLMLDCGESGSTLRFFMPLAACLRQPVAFTGQGRLMERPLDPYFDLFAEHGVTVTRDKEGKRLIGQPNSDTLTVTGPWQGGTFSLPGHISSQFVSGLLLALPLLVSDSTIVMTTPLESRSYVDITLDVMKAFGVEARHHEYQEFSIPGRQCYQPRSYAIEGDYSQAAFFLVAAALGCSCVCKGLKPDSCQGDRKVIDILRRCGAHLYWENDVLRVQAETLTGITVDISDIPDLVAPLAVLFCFCQGESRIINGSRLRYKESDRLTAVASELRKLGADIEEGEDSLLIRGVNAFTGGQVDSWGDHRIAMMLAVAALKSTGPVRLTGSQSVAKSYPNFFGDFEKVPRQSREGE